MKALEDRVATIEKEIAELRKETKLLQQSSLPDPAQLRQLDPERLGEMFTMHADREGGSLTVAQAVAQALVEAHPDSSQAARAYWWLAWNLRDSEPVRARHYMQELLRRHPGTVQAGHAGTHLVQEAWWNEHDTERVLSLVASLQPAAVTAKDAPQLARVVRQAARGTGQTERAHELLLWICRRAEETAGRHFVGTKTGRFEIPPDAVGNVRVEIAALLHAAGRHDEAAAAYRQLISAYGDVTITFSPRQTARRLLDRLEKGQPLEDDY